MSATNAKPAGVSGNFKHSSSVGLDIHICVNNSEQISSLNYPGFPLDYLKKYGLSRRFCNFMCRQRVIDGEPELDQIGRLTSIDISPIYQMETYNEKSDEEIQHDLDNAEDEEERQEILEEVEENKKAYENLTGNIDAVLFTVNALIEKLSTIDNLPELLNDYGDDTLDYPIYFTDFNIDRESAYLGNNFGQDLRNFRRFLHYAKEQRTTTVYFYYG